MSMRDRLQRANPVLHDLITLFDSMITAINELIDVTFTGGSPHKVNDTVNEVSASDPTDLETLIVVEWELDVAYVAHLASTTYHIAADSTNTLTALSTYGRIKALADELKVDYAAHRILTVSQVHGEAAYDAIKLLADELKVDYEAHRVIVGSGEHARGADATNALSEPDVTDKATAFALVNDIQTQFNAHCALDAVTGHTVADTTNPVVGTALDGASSWAEIQARLDLLRTAYEAHRILVAGTVHGAADSTNTVTAPLVGVIAPEDVVNVVTAPVVTSKATAFALVNDIQTQFNAHCALVADVHGAADSTNPVVGTALDADSTWTEIQVRLDLLRVGYEAHRVIVGSSEHGSADATNTVTAAAVGAPQTSVNAYLTELKGDFNAHLSLMTSHTMKDNSMLVDAAASTTLATGILLAGALIYSFNDHISMANESEMAIPTLDELE